MGVQYSLWGGSILNLGTEKHKKAYFEDIDKFRLPGDCLIFFCSTGNATLPAKVYTLMPYTSTEMPSFTQDALP
jgi:hypothetical protein